MLQNKTKPSNEVYFFQMRKLSDSWEQTDCAYSQEGARKGSALGKNKA